MIDKKNSLAKIEIVGQFPRIDQLPDKVNQEIDEVDLSLGKIGKQDGLSGLLFSAG